MFNKISTSAIRCVSLLLTLLILGVGNVLGNTAKIEQEEFNGNRAWSGPHANFVITAPSSDDWGTTTVGGDGRKLQLSGGKTFTISWTLPDKGYDITVTKIKAKIGAPLWGFDLYFNETKCGHVNGWSTKDNVYLDNLSLGNNDVITVRLTETGNIYYFEITYTITPHTPTPTNGSVNVTINPSAKNTLDVASLFSIDDDVPTDFNLEYDLISAYAHGWIISETTNFWADAAGEYVAKARVVSETDHNASEWSYATITVNRLANTLTVAGTEYEKFVDDTIPDIVSNVNSDATITTTTSDGTVAYYDVAKDSIFIPNSSAKTFDEKTVTLHIQQAQTSQYEAVDKTITLLVKKHDNVLSATNDGATMLLFSTLDGGVLLSATNTDYVGSPISCEEQIAGVDTLTYSYTQGTRTVAIASHQFLGTGTWRFTQPENYKYKAGAGTFSVTVVNETCRFYGSKTSKSWDLATNWESSKKPTDDYASVIIDGELELTGTEEKKAYSISITSRPDASITISPKAGLTVGAGGISGTNGSNLILQADSIPESGTVGQTGFLRISPDYKGEMPEAIVMLYSIAVHNSANTENNKSFYQCLGAPISDEGVAAKSVFGPGTWLYTWDETAGEEGEWINNRVSKKFEPFRGFDVTQKKGPNGWLFKFNGHLVSGADPKEISLDGTHTGNNLLANSFTAPISISSFDDGDFDNAYNTIYILNAGTKAQSLSKAGGIDSPGKWVGIPTDLDPEDLAGEGYPCVIPAMQGFWVQAKSGGGSVTLDYSKLVWDENYSGCQSNTGLRAPRRNANEEMPITGKLKINIYGEESSDGLFMLESERYDQIYEDGYDARKIQGEGVEIFSITDGTELSIDATNSIAGTRLGVRTGEETAYTMNFCRVSGETSWALLDSDTKEEFPLYEGAEYTFFAEPNAVITDRFSIIEIGSQEHIGVTTDCEKVNSGTKVQKFIQNGQMFVLKNGVLYNAQGLRVR